MAKKESSFINMVATLFVVTLIAALSLGGIYNVTKEPIAAAKRAKTLKALKAVMPEFDTVFTYKVLPEGASDSLTFNKGYQADQFIGYAIESYSNKGYDPTQIKVMIGFTPTGEIIRTSVIQHKETPGLGTKMSDPKFYTQFEGKNPDSFNLQVKKDGGEVDAITAATITSRAFCDAIILAHTIIKKEGGNN